MEVRKQGIQINFAEDEKSTDDVMIICIGTVLSWMLFLTLEALLFRIFELDGAGVNRYLFGAVGILTVAIIAVANRFLGARYKYGRVYVALGFVLLVLLIAFIWGNRFRYGLNCYGDQLALLRTEATAQIQRRFDVGPDPSWAMRGFSLWVAALTGALSYLIAFEGKKIATVLVAAMMFVSIAQGLIRPDIYFTAVTGMLMIVVGVRFLMDNNGVTRKRGVMINGIVMIAVLAAMLGAAILLPWQNVFVGNAFQERAAHWLHSQKYEKHVNPMPEGDLNNVRPFEPTGRVSLTVTMSQPEMIYLKGFVGENYEGGRWTRARGEFYRKNSDIFYWLHKDGFYGQSQGAMLSSLMKDVKVGTIEVKNIGACSKYIYAPYSLYQKGNVVADARGIGDATIENRDKGETVKMSYVPGTVYRSYVLQNEYATGVDNSKESMAYRDQESAFRKIAYDHYLDVPENLENILRESLGEREELSSTEAKIRILAFLDKNIKYRPREANQGKNELISTFLSERKAGHSVHYAAASTMMLRYFGVPARYVEGFMVTAEEASEIGKNVPFPITEKNAHAWTEYYLEGVGWIPFETVPGKRNKKMYAAAGNAQAEDGEEGAAGKVGEADKADTKNDETEKISDKTNFNNPINSWQKVFVFKKVIAVVLALMLILAALAWVMIRRARLGRFKKTFEGENIRRGTINAFAYGKLLIKKREKMSSIDLSEEETYGEAKRINDIALYSTQEIDRGQRSKVIEMKDSALRLYRSERNILQRFYDMFILCIY